MTGGSACPTVLRDDGSDLENFVSSEIQRVTRNARGCGNGPVGHLRASMASRKGIGGPTTAEGKGRSSQNSTKHGARSTNVLILGDERQADYDETRDGWLADYEPADYHEMRLVEQLILNDWLLKRANRRLMQAETEPENEHRLELMLRYKTTHERAFYRSLNAIEGLRKDIRREKIISKQFTDKARAEIGKARARTGGAAESGDGNAGRVERSTANREISQV